MNLGKFVVAIVIGFLFVSSGHAIDGDEAKTNKDASGWEFYGNFCGPGHPARDAATRIGELQQLMAIVPKDDIDLACKRHDICYTVYGSRELYCDETLTTEIRAMKFPESVEDQCHHVARSIIDAFELVTPAVDRDNFGNTIGSYLKKFGSLATSTPMAGMTYGMRTTKGMPASSDLCNDLTPMDNRYPPRYRHGVNKNKVEDEICQRRAAAAYIEALKQHGQDTTDISDRMQHLSEFDRTRIRANIAKYPNISENTFAGYEAKACVDSDGAPIKPLDDVLAESLEACRYLGLDEMVVRCAVFMTKRDNNKKAASSN